MNDYELLEKYIKGLLKDKELIDFEKRLKTESELADQLKLLQQLKDYTFKREKQEVELQLKNIVQKQRQKKRKTRLLYMYSLVAASIALLIYFTFTDNSNKNQKQLADTENIDSLKQTEKQIKKDSIPQELINTDKKKQLAGDTPKNKNERQAVKKLYYVYDYSDSDQYGFAPVPTDSFKITVLIYPAKTPKYMRKNDTIFLKGYFNEKLTFYKENESDTIIMQYNGHKFTLGRTNSYKKLK